MENKLNVGMRDEEVYDEIRGKVSGENSTQIQDFLKPSRAGKSEKPNPLHEVIKTGNGYSLIRKYPNLFDTGGLYVSGINDEHAYFIHKLEDTMHEKAISGDFGEFMNVMNKTDHGFIRVQGDLLMSLESRDFVKEEAILKLDNNMREKYKTSIFQKSFINIFKFKGKNYKLVCFGKCLIFGNHLLSVEKHGGIYEPIDDAVDHLLVTGKFKLFHMEHDTVNMNLDKDKICRLTSQTLTDKKIYETGVEQLPQRSQSWE